MIKPENHLLKVKMTGTDYLELLSLQEQLKIEKEKHLEFMRGASRIMCEFVLFCNGNPMKGQPRIVPDERIALEWAEHRNKLKERG